MVTNNLTGLSTDTKPYAEEESLFLELDTGNWYYCTGGNAWTKVDGLSGVKVDNALIGKSTDGKPNASENTIFIEVDTGKTYYCDGSSWTEIPSSGGGGGGANQAVVTLDIRTNNDMYLKCTYDAEQSYTFPVTMESGAYIMNDNEDDEPYTIHVYKEQDIEALSGTITLPLMGDTHSFQMYGTLQNVTVAVSGGVTDTPLGDYHIFTVTGDGTITFS